MTKAVIFDMDGVIIDSEPIYIQHDLEFARKRNPQVRLEDLFGMVGATKQDAWEVMEKAIHNGQSWQELRDEYRKHDVFQDVDYRAIFRPSVRGLLNRLKALGYRLALASSTHMELILRVLDENEIREFFEVVVSGEQFTKSKPHPEIYLHTARALKVEPEECLVLEDSTIGITAASRAGMKVAALIDDRFGFDRSLADFQVEKPEDILSLPGF